MIAKRKITKKQLKEGSEDQKKATAMREHVLSWPLGAAVIIPELEIEKENINVNKKI